VTSATSSCADEHCITCGDVAVVMTVVDVDAARELALCVADSGEQEMVEISLVSPVHPAERLLVHARVAIAQQGGVL
jgi:hypothetical protein